MSADPAEGFAYETINETAGAWVARLASGPLDDGEQRTFDAWMDQAPSHAAAFDRALTVWQALHAIGDAPEIIAHRAEALDAMRRANARRWSRRTDRSPWWIGGAVAASLALVLAVVMWMTVARMPGTEQFATGTGERRVVTLADGSRLSLDADTAVDVALSGEQRMLTLRRGRAKFDVAHDTDRPFTVAAGNRTVVATGTAFSVELLQREVHVILYEGKVQVLTGAPPALSALKALRTRPDPLAQPLVPGRELVAALTSTAPAAVRPDADVGRSLAWEGGQLNFVDEPLPSAIERLNRYSKVQIVADDPRAQAIAVNGVFNSGDSNAFVEAVSDAYGLRAVREGERIRLLRR